MLESFRSADIKQYIVILNYTKVFKTVKGSADAKFLWQFPSRVFRHSDHWPLQEKQTEERQKT